MMGPEMRRRLEIAGFVAAGAVTAVLALQQVARWNAEFAEMGSPEDWRLWETAFEGKR